MGNNPEQLLKEIYLIARKVVEENNKDVQEILANLEISFEEYQQIVAQEIVDDFYVKASFAFPPHQNHKPEDLKKEARRITRQKLARDKRLFIP